MPLQLILSKYLKTIRLYLLSSYYLIYQVSSGFNQNIFINLPRPLFSKEGVTFVIPRLPNVKCKNLTPFTLITVIV